MFHFSPLSEIFSFHFIFHLLSVKICVALSKLKKFSILLFIEDVKIILFFVYRMRWKIDK